MSETTNIEWADSTFNPWIGCTRVSPACDDCYAARSTPARALGVVWGSGKPRRRTSDANWKQPERWEREHDAFFAEHGRRRRVFCASLADVFDNEVDTAWRMDLFSLIAETPKLDWLVLTKRIGNVMPMCSDDSLMFDMLGRNVWLGITVVNQAEADRDIPKLLAVPARVRFLSIDPMLSHIDVWRYLPAHCERHPPPLDSDGKCGVCEGRGIWALDDPLAEFEKAPIRPGIDWVIAGGESGPNARPSHPDWYRSLRDQCAMAGVPFLFKQWGEWLGELQDGSPTASPIHINAGDSAIRIGKKAAGRLLDGIEHNAFPEVHA